MRDLEYVMTLSVTAPDQALHNIEQRRRQYLDEAILVVEAILASAPRCDDVGLSWFVDLGIQRSAATVDLVVVRYQAAGWEISWDSLTRHRLTFRPKPKRADIPS